MQQPQAGNLTFLFTEIEGSAQLWERSAGAMTEASANHDRILRTAIEQHGGLVFKTVGGSFYSVFESALNSALAAVDAQREIMKISWPDDCRIAVRAAIHCGEVDRRGNDYFGQPLNRTARILAIGHGGQILLSQAVRDRIDGAAARDIGLLDLASHRLKDLGRPEHVWQVVHHALPSSFPPLRSLQAYANNLPEGISSFVGRDRETELVKDLLARHRLATIAGLGGCGKTSLALRVAADVVELHGDGVWFVGLEAIGDNSLVVGQVARALGVREQHARPLVDTMVAHLERSSTLLVLDTCEHLLAGCAELVNSLLGSCPTVKVLATSREPLGLICEHVCRIGPFDIPEPSPADCADPVGRALEYDAVRLFVDRAREASGTFAFASGNLEAVTSVCRRLDGIPLAIELAAARVAVLPPAQIAQRLDDPFLLLTKGPRSAPPRQQTLRSLIDWSYDLLTRHEKLLLARLSVFARDWSLESAAEVSAGDGIDRSDLPNLLAALVSKSLVTMTESESGPEYAMIELVRLYAAEKLKRMNGKDLSAGSIVPAA
jgi:predicted ATPase/class 3 adenylate cyclase